MDILLQQVVNGLVLGSIYALIALGYTMVYGILGIVNFAHGEVLMMGSMIALTVIGLIHLLLPGLPDWLLLLIALAASHARLRAHQSAHRALRLPAAAQRAADHCYRRVHPAPDPGDDRLVAQPPAVPPAAAHQAHAALRHRGQHHGKEIAIIVTTVAIMAGLLLLVRRMRLGRAMRATAENIRIAQLMGVNPNTVIAATFMIGGALAALAGVMIASNYGSAHFYMGFITGLKAFTTAVLGGIFGSNYQDIFTFIVLIAVLVFRPSGIMGERVADRA